MTPIPGHLPAPPPLKPGYHWEYRGKGWSCDSPRYFAFFQEGKDTEWQSMPLATRPYGSGRMHYIERVITPTPSASA
jgi:hypothetical protein